MKTFFETRDEAIKYAESFGLDGSDFWIHTNAYNMVELVIKKSAWEKLDAISKAKGESC